MEQNVHHIKPESDIFSIGRTLSSKLGIRSGIKKCACGIETRDAISVCALCRVKNLFKHSRAPEIRRLLA